MSEQIDFHMAPQTRSMTVHWMLEEIGAPYQTHVLDLEGGAHKRPEYLAINPMGKVPALVHKGTVITEVAAICLYLADAFPTGLAPPIGDPARGTYLRWLVFATSCAEPAILDLRFERAPSRPRSLGYGDFDTVVEVVAEALTPGPYLLGDRFSAADVVLGSGIQWGLSMKLLPELLEFTAYAAHLGERPALQRAMTQEAAMSPAKFR